MPNPTCDFYCEKILNGLLDVPVYFENERVFAFHHTPLRGCPRLHEPGGLPILQAPPLAHRLRKTAAALLMPTVATHKNPCDDQR